MTELSQARDAAAAVDRVAHRIDWRRSTRWFLSEFLVVVTGVVVALALNAWWQDRQDDKRELIYLRQLSADLAASDKELGDVHALFIELAQASAIVCHEFWRRDELSDDAIYEKMTLPMRSRRALPVLGTARALIASGDLRLIRSVPLRNAVTTYVDSMDAHVADVARYDETYYREGIHLVSSNVDIYAMFQPKQTDRTLAVRPDGASPAPFPVNLDAVLKDRSIYNGYQMLLTGHRGQATRYGDMQEETQALLKQVTAVLAKMGT
jgi:hypothetical protein